MANYYDLNFCMKLAESKGGKCLSTEYISASTKMEWQCEFGHIWHPILSNILSGHWCRRCSEIAKNDKKRYSLQHCIDLATSKNGKCLSTEYQTARKKIKWQCGTCSYIWDTSYDNARRYWCPDCAGIVKYTLDECIGFAIQKGGICCSTTYSSVKKVMKWACESGHIWDASFDSLVNSDSWCNECSYNERGNAGRLDFEYVKEFVSSCGFVLKSEQYILANLPLEVECVKCLKTWNKTFNSIQQGKGCRKCSRQMSKAQEAIFEYVKAILPELIVLDNDRKALSGMELDVYIPVLNKAIEYDGDYWHYDKRHIKTSTRRMKKKNRLCKERKIELLRIREYMWEDDNEFELQKIVDFILDQ